MPSFHSGKYMPCCSCVGKLSFMGLFQFGFLQKKQKENERGDGREGEEDRDVKEQKVEEISTNKKEVGKQLNKKVPKHVGD